MKLIITTDDEIILGDLPKTNTPQLSSKLNSFGIEVIEQLPTGDITNRIQKICIEKGLSLATAESCTGGLVASHLLSFPGASAYFKGGFITYSNESKSKLLSVPEDLLNTHGAVSSKCALAMARGAMETLQTDLALSITGILGPGGGTDDKPVGTVFVGCRSKEKEVTEKYSFSRSRKENRLLVLHSVLNLLYAFITQGQTEGPQHEN
jgi:PncC family amidohydrolase